MQLPPGQRCAFVRQTAACRDVRSLLDYMRLLMCHMQPNAWLGVICLLVCIALFIVVLIVNAEFNAPHILHIAEQMYMSEYLSGATLLAIYSAASGIALATRTTQMDGPLQSSTMLGTVLFTSAVIGGIVLCMRPLRMPFEYMLWHSGAYAVCILYGWIVQADLQITMVEVFVAGMLLLIYACGSIGLHVWKAWRLRNFAKGMSMERSSGSLRLSATMSHGDGKIAAAELRKSLQSNLKKAGPATKKNSVSRVRFRIVCWNGSHLSTAVGQTDEARPDDMWSDFWRFLMVVMKSHPRCCRRWYFRLMVSDFCVFTVCPRN